jgi:hypothetical protein
MPQTRTRPFGVIDSALLAGVVVLSVLAACATDRESSGLPADSLFYPSWSRWPSWLHPWIRSAHRLRTDTVAFLGTFALGLAVIAYRPRRDRLGRRGPGHIAVGLAALLALYYIVTDVTRRWIIPLIPLPPGTSIRFPPLLFTTFFLLFSFVIAPAIVAAWLTLALSGGWRPSMDWTDRLGRWVGWSWIGAYLWDVLVNGSGLICGACW